MNKTHMNDFVVGTHNLTMVCCKAIIVTVAVVIIFVVVSLGNMQKNVRIVSLSVGLIQHLLP